MLLAKGCEKMEKINVEIRNKNKKYPVFIGNAVLAGIPEFIKSKHKDKKIVIITEDNIKKLHEKSILDPLKTLKPFMISVPAGENSKSRETKQEIEDMLLEKNYGRDTVIIAFGGGVIGDLAGFVASTFMRGIPLMHVPTSLLAMVDSSIGGKTSIDTKHGKNLVGTIYQPDAVFSDLNFLKTLPKEEFLNGLAEVIKMAIILDKALFEFIEKNHEKILSKEKDSLLHIIRRSIELKKDIVEKDERESGLRQILNFGHTIGHAIEADSGFKIKHGHSISIGMAVESKIAVLLGDLSADDEKRIIHLLDLVGLPTRIKHNKTGSLIKFMVVDKKTRKQKPRFVILKKIGRIKTENNNFSHEVSEDLIKKSIGECKDD